MKLSNCIIQIQHPRKTLDFYQKNLGATFIRSQQEKTHTNYHLSFSNSDFELILSYQHIVNIPVYEENLTDNYWKYSLFVNDIKTVFDCLCQENHQMGEPFQLGQIGYLAHTQDCEFHKIEFIQKTFKDCPIQKTKTTAFPLKEQPIFGLITIRSKDPIKSIHFYETFCEMKLLVRMHVDRGNGFSLYFLGDKNMTPPSSNIDAIENREWMYQQKSCFIEIQYHWNSEHDQDFNLIRNPLGLQSIGFKTPSLLASKNQLSNYAEEVKIINDTLEINSPDGHLIVFYSS